MSVLLVLAVLGGTLAGTLHMLAVPHRLCEVHGTIEHGFAGDAEAEFPLAASARAPHETGSPAGTSYQSDPGPHEECDFRPCTRPEKALVPEPPPAFLGVLEPCGKSFVRAVLAPRTLLYLDAPSRSPPA